MHDYQYFKHRNSCKKCSDEARVNDLFGKQFNNITVISHPIHEKGRIYYMCECVCGNIVKRRQDDIGNIISCGCHLHTRNNESRSRLYGIWYDMNYRCSDKASGHNRKNYFERGIIVCEEWNFDNPKGYENFKNWALSHEYDDNLTIERKNVNDNYYPQNCEWIPMPIQAKNKTNTVKINYGEKEYKACDLQNEAICYATIKRRIQSNTEEDKLLTNLTTNNHSGKIGVCRTSNGMKWRAYITINKKVMHLGTFDLLEDAIKTREEAEKKYYSNNNYTGNIVKRVIA